MGAQKAYGIDIDLEAVSHAQKNAQLNQLKASFSTDLPPLQGIVLLNMILPEQKQVLEQIPLLPNQATLWITSGILASQESEALQFYRSFGLQLVEKRQRGEWLGLKLRKESPAKTRPLCM